MSDWHEVSLLPYVFLIETCVDIDASVSKNKEDHKAGKVEPEEGIHIESKRVPDKASNTTLEPFHYDSDGDDVLDKSLNKKSRQSSFGGVAALFGVIYLFFLFFLPVVS